MNDNTFMEAVRAVLRTYRSPGPCPDQYVGDVLVTSSSIAPPRSSADCSDFAERQSIPPSRRSDTPAVILVLESPHTNEYVDTTGPAKGRTGENIRMLLGEACNLRHCLHNGSYPLILVNAIQYQCSLGCSTECFRDRVFAEVWERGGKRDFQDRIEAVHREGDVIVNACTAGKRTPKNWELVKDALEEMGLVHAKVEHPANWSRRRNTALKHNRRPDYGWKYPIGADVAAPNKAMQPTPKSGASDG